MASIANRIRSGMEARRELKPNDRSHPGDHVDGHRNWVAALDLRDELVPHSNLPTDLAQADTSFTASGAEPLGDPGPEVPAPALALCGFPITCGHVAMIDRGAYRLLNS